ncbi:exonuclease SbcCD subunit D [Dermatobacter hominis]|uniref:exonuclease SbcCD subunit D n=1 Tax=Dermatobacter hominis TaxID=2884263 RepID=UPI001D100817|nr:exonuclease SbcCD subunit D [Dermatobacter hominis]UDY34762.1 exonuclease SbcCD subunit D [Dermatobacter hominis]
MRFLHTSDWHLGRQFHGASLLDEQSAAVDRMVELAASERVDAVLVAGDLYDRAIPATPAVELLDEALLRLRDTGAVVVAISGNHDSASRAGFGDRLMSRAGVTVRADVRRFAEPVVVPHADGDVVVHPVPYLDPVTFEAAHPSDPDPGDAPDGADPTTISARRGTHQQTLGRAVRALRSDRRRRKGLRSVVVAHAFVAGTAPRLDEAPVEVCDSERQLAVGGADRVEPSLFDGFDYVALGHLHGHQSWADERIAYSGSPLRYSFSEEHHRKGVRIVDLSPDGGRSVEFVELGIGRPLHTVRGRLDDLLVDPALDAQRDGRIRAVLTDPHLPHQAMARLRTRFPHAAELVHEPPERSQAPVVRTSHEVRRRQPLDLALDFLAEQWDEAPDRAATAAVRDAVVAVVGSER